MNIGIIGSGHIGANVGKLLARKGHKLYFAFSHDEQKLEALAAEVGNESKAASLYDAVMCSEVVLFSPPWTPYAAWGRKKSSSPYQPAMRAPSHE